MSRVLDRHLPQSGATALGDSRSGMAHRHEKGPRRGQVAGPARPREFSSDSVQTPSRDMPRSGTPNHEGSRAIIRVWMANGSLLALFRLLEKKSASTMQ